MAYTKRPRDPSNTVVSLDLADAAAANRRLDVGKAGEGLVSMRLLGFSWSKTPGVPVDIQILRVDTLNGDKATLLEERLGDTGESGTWRPPVEEVAGTDPRKRTADTGTIYRLQFGQAGAPCTCDPTADYKEF